jgi:hypothetical protein
MYENKKWEELFPKYNQNLKNQIYFSLADIDEEKAKAEVQESILKYHYDKSSPVYFDTIVDWQKFDFKKFDQIKATEIDNLVNLGIDEVHEKYGDEFTYLDYKKNIIAKDISFDEEEIIKNILALYFLKFNKLLHLNELPFRLGLSGEVFSKKQYYYVLALYNRSVKENKPWQELLPLHASRLEEAKKNHQIKRLFDIKNDQFLHLKNGSLMIEDVFELIRGAYLGIKGE